MRRIAFMAGLAAIALLGGGARPQTPLTAPVQAPASAVQPMPQPPAPALAPTAPIACEATSLAYLVGKPRSAIPVPVNPSDRRVSCTTCPVTEDYRPDRTDILFDAETGLITAVKCG